VTFTPREVGETGPQGKPGAGAPTGAAGASSATDAPGVPRASGPRGLASSKAPKSPKAPRSPKPTKPSSIANLLSTDRRAMIRIDAKRIVVPMKGRKGGRVRISVFCRRVAVLTCFGNLKLRTAAKINPASLGQPRKKRRRVTWDIDDFQLDAGEVGFAILDFDPQARGLLKRVGATRSTVVISVIDAKSRRQHIRAKVTLVAAKR
jgi:hypothetical protein